MSTIAPTVQIISCDPLKGRQAPTGASHTTAKSANATLEVPSMPLDKDEPKIKIRRPHLATHSLSALAYQPHIRQKKDEGNYAMKFSDSTWAHSNPPDCEHIVSREEVLDIINKFDNMIETMVSSDDMEHAWELQAATDMLMDSLSSMLRVTCLEQCTLAERARNAYATAFTLLGEDSRKCREVIHSLETRTNHLEENLTKVIDNATERVKEAQMDCERQIADMQKKMEEKKEEYDASMKRFLEQKQQLEEHVKALHTVFLDFQSDSVYITLEDLKQKLQNYEKKLKNKDNDIGKLNTQLAKLARTISDGEEQRRMLEQANDDLRRQLQAAMARANRLQRRLEMQHINEGGDFEDIDPDEEVSDASDDKKPVISPVTQDARVSQRNRRHPTTDSAPFYGIMQKLSLTTDCIGDAVARCPVEIPLPKVMNSEETDKAMLSGNSTLMIKAVEAKASEVFEFAKCLELLEFSGEKAEDAAKLEMPRFLHYIRAYNRDSEETGSTMPQAVSSSLMTIREIFNAKYLSDKLNTRLGQKLTRFPEFVLTFFYQDGERLFTAISRCARLWKSVESSKVPEVKLFKHFLVEKLTVDELAFFMEARHSLVGLRPVSKGDPEIIAVPWQKCENFLVSMLGAYSPILQPVTQESQKHILNGSIDYAIFLTILMTHYQNERRKRRNAVRLMFQSKAVTMGDCGVDFENFVSMVQSLGFQGSMDDVLSLFREALLFGNGTIKTESVLQAMDDLSFHFYAIEIPMTFTKRFDLTKLTRHQMLQHWIRFGSWFSAFRLPTPQLDPWFKSYIINQVRTVDQMFKANMPVSELFSQYRQLLDQFQYGLDVLARSHEEPMTVKQSERQLSLLENLIDLLITFIVRDCNGEIVFSESS